MRDLYDLIGPSYARSRTADPRIVSTLAQLLGPAQDRTVADIGAGTGNYSLALAREGWTVAALEPSRAMRAQRAADPRVHWAGAAAESLPFASFRLDAAVCVLALHHFDHLLAGLAEMARVVRAGPIVIFTFDPAAPSPFWLHDYFPGLRGEGGRKFPQLAELKHLLATAACAEVREIPFPLPPDLTDRFTASGWRSPEIYLDAEARSAMSAFALADPSSIDAGLDRLRADLDSGLWRARYGAILGQDSFDAGYRFLSTCCAEPASVSGPIEPAAPDDAPALLDLQHLCYQGEAVLYDDFAIAPLTESLAQVEAEIRAGRVLVLRWAGRVVGSVRGFAQNGTCHVGRLIVHPRFQRQGLGARLMTAIEDLFPSASAFELFTGHLSASNLRLYRRLGYREFERRPVTPALEFVHLRKSRS